MVPNKIIIHNSASKFGTSRDIRKWHVVENGWDDIGYHYIILNGYEAPTDYLHSLNGSIEMGRPSNISGAHTKGHNDSIGICLIGQDYFSEEQMDTLLSLVGDLCLKYNIPQDKVFGHYEFNKYKTCPNLDMSHIRRLIGGMSKWQSQ